MAPVEVHIDGRFAGISSSGVSSVKDRESGIDVNYFGDGYGTGAVKNTDGSAAGGFQLAQIGSEDEVRANPREVPPVEKGGESTIVYESTVRIKRV